MVIDYNMRESAVSPVVGVMLMLVVTIIIAALVSAFSGGLIGDQDKVPKATITGTYSQSKGLTMTHAGGDSLQTSDINVFVRKSDEFGYGQEEVSAKKLNISTISTGTLIKGERTYWRERFGTWGVVSWLPGETMYIINDGDENGDIANSGLDIGEVTPYYSAFDQASGNARFYTGYLNNQFNIGKTLTLEVYQKDGTLISSYDMTIEP